ncbi:MAG: CusA/CzcA family heavy metal efflux RND transporter [Planctomycetota bacterium]
MLEKLVELVIRHRVIVLLLTVLIVAIGIYAWRKIDIDAFPDATNIQVMILTDAPGLAAVDVEQQVTYPIESQMGGLPHVRQVRSLSKAGLSQVVVIFEDSIDIYFARQVVNERLQAARELLPEGIEPELGPVSTGLGEIYQYTLKSTVKNPMELRTIQDWVIAPQLRTIPGVTEVNSFGGFVKQYQVEVLPEKLAKYGLTLRDVYETIRQNNANAGGNYIIKGWEQSYIRSIGLVSSISDLENIVLTAKNGTPVFLKDVALIKLGPETRQGAVTRDGQDEVVAGMVIMLKGSNSKEVVDRVKDKIPKIQETLAQENVQIDTFYDRTSLIQSCISTVEKAMLEGIILVILVLFIFLWEVRAGLIIACSLPVSILGAFILMKALGIPANLMSLGGLAIALGKVADVAIIVTENIIRHLSDPSNHSLNKIEKIKNALKEVIGPITFAMLIIIIVFAPLFALQDVEGKMFKPLAVTNTLVLLVSLFTGLVIIPVICVYFLKASKERENLMMRSVKKIYQPVLLWVMKHNLISISGAVIIFISSLLAFNRLGSEFMPPLDEGSIAINIVRLPSASLEGSVRVGSEIEKRLVKIPEIQTIVAKTGRAEISEDPMGPEQTDFFIMLKDKTQWRKGIKKKDLLDEINTELKQIPGIKPSFSQPIALRVNELISGIKSDLAIKIFGDDLQVLQAKAIEVSQILSETKGSADVKIEPVSGFLQVHVEIDRSAIARHKINVSDINEIIETAVGGKIASWVVEGRMRFAILVRFPAEHRRDIRSLENILIPSPEGYQVPLGNLAKIIETEGPAQISHENNRRRIVVECNIRERDTGSFVSEIQNKIKPLEKGLPTSYFVEFGGQFENQQRAQNTLKWIVPLSILLIFCLLFLSFDSIKNALLVLLNVPFALVGGVFALYISGQYLSVSSSIGFIALFGVAMLDGIVLVSCIQKFCKQRHNVQEAIVNGALLRLRPILMTATAMIIGFIPLLTASGPGAEIQRPLAIVGVGGLITSTVLTLLLLPCLYNLFESKSLNK